MTELLQVNELLNLKGRQALPCQFNADGCLFQLRRCSWTDVDQRAIEQLDQLVELGQIDLTKDLPSEGDIEARLQRQSRERENLGAVNLRAEVELAEMQEQKDTMVSERDDLIAAIEKLRNGINQLNREARARLKAAFDEVDKHFQQLFVLIIDFNDRSSVCGVADLKFVGGTGTRVTKDLGAKTAWEGKVSGGFSSALSPAPFCLSLRFSSGTCPALAE